jgi:ankyrin repeat protein
MLGKAFASNHLLLTYTSMSRGLLSLINRSYASLTSLGYRKDVEWFLLIITLINTTDIIMENLDNVTLHAARLGNKEVLKELIDKKVDINIQDDRGYTPLILACYNNHYEAADLLLQAGADVNGYDFGGNTALMGVSFKGYADIAELLINNGADLDLQHGNGGTALMFAAMFGRNELVKLLLSHGADKTILDTRGLSVTDLALQQGNDEAIALLE